MTLNFFKPFLVICLLPLITSCYTYRVFPVEDRRFVTRAATRTAYVVNPQLKKENAIVTSSSIFNWTRDSSEADVRIVLHPMNKRLACGNGVVGYAFFLGQLPLYLPDRYYFAFDEIGNTGTIQKKFELHVATRYWFWSFLVFNKRFDEKAGLCLSANYFRS